RGQRLAGRRQCRERLNAILRAVERARDPKVVAFIDEDQAIDIEREDASPKATHSVRCDAVEVFAFDAQRGRAFSAVPARDDRCGIQDEPATATSCAQKRVGAIYPVATGLCAYDLRRRLANLRL